MRCVRLSQESISWNLLCFTYSTSIQKIIPCRRIYVKQCLYWLGNKKEGWPRYTFGSTTFSFLPEMKLYDKCVLYYSLHFQSTVSDLICFTYSTSIQKIIPCRRIYVKQCLYWLGNKKEGWPRYTFGSTTFSFLPEMKLYKCFVL